MGAVPLTAASVPVTTGAVPLVVGAGVATGETAASGEAIGIGTGDTTGTTCVTGAVPCPRDAQQASAAIAAKVQNRKNIPLERFIGLRGSCNGA
jgi:hypothetical protein